MSGIAGYFRFKTSRSGSERGIIKRMLLSLTGAGSKSTVFSNENTSMGLGAVDALVHDVSFSDGDPIAVAFHGHLTNKRDIMAGEQLTEGHGSESDLIIHLYRKYGQSLNQQLKGKYCFALWDSEKQIMFLSADRYGYGYLYYYQDEHWCVFATEIKAILKVLEHKPEPNMDAICDIYNFHTVYGNDTQFRNIFLLPYGSYALLSKQGLKFKRYWEYPMYPQHDESSETDLLEITKEKMFSSVRNAIQDYDNIGVMITSGLDSRWIAGAVKKLFPGKNTFLYHLNNGRENLSAIKDMAHVLEMPLIIFNEEKNDLIEKALNDYIYLTDGHWAIYDFIKGIQGLKVKYDNPVLFTGYLCDVIFQPTFLRPFYSVDEEKLFLTFMNCFSAQSDFITDQIFIKNFAEQIKDRKKARISETVTLFRDAHPVEQALRFYNINRGRRHVHHWMYNINQYVKVATPGTDYELYDLAMNIPRHLRANTRFYISAIVQLFPDLGEIIWGRTKQMLKYGDRSKSKLRSKYIPLLKYIAQRLSHGKFDFRTPPIII